VTVIVVPGRHEEADSVLLDEVVGELPPVLVLEEGELVLLNELVAGASGEVILVPTKQVQALLIFELDAEHLDRKLGRAEVAVTRLVVYVTQNAEAEAALAAIAR
jgi:hypothetical protein